MRFPELDQKWVEARPQPAGSLFVRPKHFLSCRGCGGRGINCDVLEILMFSYGFERHGNPFNIQESTSEHDLFEFHGFG